MGARPLLRFFGLGLIVLALLLTVFIAVAYLGYESGQKLRVTRVEQTRTAAVAIQVERATADVEAGNYRLALRRLEWVLEREPANETALLLRTEAEAALQHALQPTLTATTTPAVTPTSSPTPSSAATSQAQAASSLRRLEQMVRAERWKEAISEIISFQSAYPDYERRKTDTLLYEAYIGQGVEELYGDQVELGIYFLSQAQALGDLPQDVLDQRQWAELYLGGIAYYGINWEVSLFYFRQLCRAAPFYQDACTTLFDILVASGDGYAARQDWCPAELLYREAYTLEDRREVAQKLNEAREGCSEATPTISAPLTATVPLDMP